MRIRYWSSDVCSSDLLQWSAAARSAELAKPHEQVEKIHLRAGKLPSVELTADFLYRFLASEIAAQRGQYAAASQTLLDLSKDTLDPRLAKRSFQLAMVGHDMDGALQAAPQWVLLAPNDPQAVRTEENTSELQALMRISYAVI